MADSATPANRSPTPPERIESSTEDPDTAAARKELDNTAISEKPTQVAIAMSTSPEDKVPAKDSTPEGDIADAQNDSMKEQISSPKKKRAHDQLDETKDSAQEANGDVSPIGANGNASLSRTDRSEPEKKRHRDISSETKTSIEEATEPTAAEESAESKGDAKSAAPEKKSTTSTSAFMNSGMSGFASQASPFLQSGDKPLSSFASASASPSPFGAAASSKTEANSLLGGNTLANGASPFGQMSGSSKPFGSSVFGGGFGGGLGGLGSNKLTSFSKPGESLKSKKPAKPFGAPPSDPESDEDDGGDDAESNNGEEEKQYKEEKEADDDKKKPRLQKVEVDDGEAGEATILQVRAKIYHLDKTGPLAAWKERGAGNLKINVPKICVDLEDNGTVIPGTFDASSLEDAESRTVRLIMRQDSTHRVILNTIIIPAMTFQEKATNKAVCVLFTAIEGEGEAVSIQLKMNPANAKSFLNEVGKIQRELQSS